MSDVERVLTVLRSGVGLTTAEMKAMGVKTPSGAIRSIERRGAVLKKEYLNLPKPFLKVTRYSLLREVPKPEKAVRRSETLKRPAKGGFGREHRLSAGVSLQNFQ